MSRRGTNNVTIRLDEDTWREFGAAMGDRSAAIREFVYWCLRRPGAKLPKRPDIDRTDDGDQGSDMSLSRS